MNYCADGQTPQRNNHISWRVLRAWLFVRRLFLALVSTFSTSTLDIAGRLGRVRGRASPCTTHAQHFTLTAHRASRVHGHGGGDRAAIHQAKSRGVGTGSDILAARREPLAFRNRSSTRGAARPVAIARPPGPASLSTYIDAIRLLESRLSWTCPGCIALHATGTLENSDSPKSGARGLVTKRVDIDIDIVWWWSDAAAVTRA